MSCRWLGAEQPLSERARPVLYPLDWSGRVRRISGCVLSLSGAPRLDCDISEGGNDAFTPPEPDTLSVLYVVGA